MQTIYSSSFRTIHERYIENHKQVQRGLLSLRVRKKKKVLVGQSLVAFEGRNSIHSLGASLATVLLDSKGYSWVCFIPIYRTILSF